MVEPVLLGFSMLVCFVCDVLRDVVFVMRVLCIGVFYACVCSL